MGGNPFYSNAEAYAYEILQQKLIKEAQRTAQQTVMELSALRSLFNQGQFVYCIPFGGSGLLGQNYPFPSPPPPPPPPPAPAPVPNFYPVDMGFITPESHYHPCPPQPPSPPQPSQPPQNNSFYGPSSGSSHNHLHPQSHSILSPQSTVHINVKNQPNGMSTKIGADECNLGKDGIDVTIDLREYLPAEIFLNVEEKSVEIRACHLSVGGSKTFTRRYDLPACIILDSVKCILTHDGYLLFSAAWMKME